MSDARKWMGVFALVLMVACTVGETPPEGPAPGPADEPGAGPVSGEPEAGDPEEAAALASELVARAERAYEAAELEESMELAERVLADHAGTAAAGPARWVGARAAFALGRYAEARSLALAYAEARPSSSEAAAEARALAELAEDALETPADAPVVVGAVLPRSGPRVLVRYADWVLEGGELAVAEAERAQGRRIELVIADDGGGERTGEAVAELEARGAVAVVGP
ncbi:MAG: hypothetical protein ACLFRX_01560, partial [Gemmatimonadota bacterium]